MQLPAAPLTWTFERNFLAASFGVPVSYRSQKEARSGFNNIPKIAKSMLSTTSMIRDAAREGE
jgi:hypothetical protein